MVALLSNAGALRKEVSRLYGDVGRLRGRSKAMHRVTGRLYRKIEGTHARIRIFQSQNGVRRNKQSSLVSASL